MEEVAMKKEKAATAEAITDNSIAKVENNSETTKDSEQKLTRSENKGVVEPHLPYRNLNPTLVEYIECVAKMTQSPIDFVVSSVFAFASGAVGNRLILRDPKGYENAPALWVCLLAVSGIGKSPVLSVVSKPFELIESEMEEEYKREKREFATKGESDNFKPTQHHAYVTMTTLEGIGKVLANEPQGCILFRDELSGWFRDFGRYSKSASGDIQGWLNIWDRKSYVTALATKDVETVKNPTLSLIGGTQPEELPRILRQELFDDGLVARLLWCYPECRKPMKYLTEPLPDSLSSFWDGLVKKLYSISPTTIAMTHAAQKPFIEYWEFLASLNASCENNEIQKFLPKFQIKVEKWAIMAEVLSSRCCDPSEKHVSIYSVGEEAINIAIKAMECFRTWSEKVVKTVYTKYNAVAVGKEDAIRCILKQYPKVTQSALADLLGVTKQYVSSIVRKQNQG